MVDLAHFILELNLVFGLIDPAGGPYLLIRLDPPTCQRLVQSDYALPVDHHKI
jgi:hypothetical protein